MKDTVPQADGVIARLGEGMTVEVLDREELRRGVRVFDTRGVRLLEGVRVMGGEEEGLRDTREEEDALREGEGVGVGELEAVSQKWEAREVMEEEEDALGEAVLVAL